MLKDGILYLENALTRDVCTRLCGWYDSTKSKGTQRDYNGNPVVYYNDEGAPRESLALLGSYAGLMLGEWFDYHGYLESVFLQRKGPGDIIEPHYDNVKLDGETPNHTPYRAMSCLFYLSTWDGGGEIVFPHQERSIHPGEGSFLAFPSGAPYLHYVEPVKKGQRYSAPVWFTNDKRLELKRR